MGIVNGKGFQIVYSDTPGIIKPNYLLQSSMMKQVENGGLDEKAKAKIAKEFVDKLKDIQPRTKAYLMEYLTNSENKLMKRFYYLDTYLRMRDLVTANGKDFKAYATEIGANTYENGQGTGYDKLRTLIGITQGAEGAYEQRKEKAEAHG